MAMVTPARLNALCNINRWGGWTVRPFSVAEHCAIGAATLWWFKRPDWQVRAFWLHDMHETEHVGDVPSPDKARYMNNEYHAAVDLFDLPLGNQAGLSRGWQKHPAIKKMDMLLRQVENDYIASQRDPDLPTPDYENDPVARKVRESVMLGTFSTHEKVFEAWERDKMWEVVGHE